MSLSMSENIRGDTQTQVDKTKDIFMELADLLSSSNEENENMYAKLVISIKNMMSDQHIVNKNYFDEFIKLRTSLIRKIDSNWEKCPKVKRPGHPRFISGFVTYMFYLIWEKVQIKLLQKTKTF